MPPGVGGVFFFFSVGRTAGTSDLRTCTAVRTGVPCIVIECSVRKAAQQGRGRDTSYLGHKARADMDMQRVLRALGIMGPVVAATQHKSKERRQLCV